MTLPNVAQASQEISMNLTIRKLTEADALTISEAFTAIGWHKPLEQYQRYLRQQQDHHIVVLVAEYDHVFAGYVKVEWQPEYPFFKEQAIPEIQDLNVLPKYRRRGIATALMDQAEALVASRSNRVGIGVGLHPGYNAAQRMYVLRGYVPDGLGVMWQDHYIREGQTVVADDGLILHLVKVLEDNR